MDDRGETPWYWLSVGSLTSDSIQSNLQFGSSQPKFVRRSISSGQTRCHASVYPAAPPNKGIGPEVVERGKLMDSIFRDDSGQSNVIPLVYRKKPEWANTSSSQTTTKSNGWILAAMVPLNGRLFIPAE